MLNCCRILLLLILTTTAQEIRLESLDDGPGLLPFKLGPTRLITHYHTFLQCIQLNDIENKILQLQTQVQTYETRLPNDTYSLYELQINYLNTKLNSALEQLHSLEPSRTKRGLIDGLGSVIKSISGNLDHSDAIKYNNAIQTLYNNENKISFELNNHISYSKEWMTKHFGVISKLVENQHIINSTLAFLMDKNSQHAESLTKFAKFAQLLAIISENVNDLLDELITLENTLAFIRASSTHHTMLKVEILSNMLVKLRKIYGRDSILDLELREFYDLIKPAYYFIDREIVLVFKFPIVTKVSYDLYQLSIAPNKYHQALIPSYPFIATNENAFVYIEAECPKLSYGYLCEEDVNHQIRTVPDCIQHLISRQSLEKTCKLTNVTLHKEAMEKLDDQHYVISLPHLTKIHLTCGREDYTQLQGSYLVTLPVNCHLRSPEFTIVNDNDEIKGNPLKIMKIPNIEMQAIDSSHINLHSIDLQSLHSIQDKIALQTPVQIDAPTTETLYHTTIPFYGVLLSATVLILVVMLRRYEILTCRRANDADTKKPENHEYESPHKSETEREGNPGRHVPATFSLKVLK
ncbi:hypothetical protein ABMA28_001824 [Loxostege sticticalis]|uniref:Envelope fusion protein n=1 Tax=Loxostege sticticalis TaxID=481309 RepID=A0ABD0T325_LOXSC